MMAERVLGDDCIIELKDVSKLYNGKEIFE